MQLENPTFIMTIGTAGTGKTETAKELCKKIPNTYWLDKELNMDFLNIRPTEQGQIPPTEEMIRHYRETGQLSETKFFNGELMYKIDFHSEFYGRHTRDQMYILMAHSAKQNLALGKHPILDALIIGRQLEDGTIPNLMSFVASPYTALLHFVADQEVIRQRRIKRAEQDSTASERDTRWLYNDEEWKKHLQKLPIYHPELEFYNHLIIDTSNQNNLPLEQALGEYVEQIIPYLAERAQQRDELLCRVDEKGQTLGAGAVHFSIAHQKGIRHRTSNAAIFKTPEKKEILLQKRAKGIRMPGIWTISCGGHNLYGYTPKETIEEEARDELFSGQELPEELQFRAVCAYPKQTRETDAEFETVYKAIYPGPFELGEEAAELKWINVDELKRNVRDNPNQYARSLPYQIKALNL